MARSRLIIPALSVVLGAAFIGDLNATEPPKLAIDTVTLSIPESLTGKPGDSAKGKQVVLNRKQGNCLDCHAMPIPEQQFHGNIGPPLNGVGSRYDEGQLRLRVVSMKLVNPSTIMPTFYGTQGFHRVAENFQGKTILSAEQLEDVVAYLRTLK